MAPRRGRARIVEPTTTRGQRTRQRLLDAAEEIFGEEGFERASIAAITGRAEVALGTFYVYFPNKQAIFSELLIELGRGLRRRLAEATRGLTRRLEIEEAGCIAFLEFVQAHKNFYKIVRQAEFVDEALYRSYYQGLAKSYAEGLRAAVDAGEIADLDPETVAYMLMGIFDFVGMRWVLWEGKLPPRRLLRDVFHFIRGGLAAPDSAAAARRRD